jgi:hypothetical protein
VPPLAISNAPGFSFVDPVNAPFSWPKSSFSRISLGSAAQFSAKKGLTLGVQSTCDQFLAGARLAEDQDAGSGRRDRIDDAVHLAHGLGRSGQLRIVRESFELGRQHPVPFTDRVFIKRLGDERFEAVQLLRGERLLDIVVGATLHRLDCRPNRGLARDDDAFRGDVPELQFFEQGQSIHAGHFQIGQDEAEPLARQPAERLLAVGHDLDVVFQIGQDRAQPSSDRWLIISDQDTRWRHTGRRRQVGNVTFAHCERCRIAPTLRCARVSQA